MLIFSMRKLIPLNGYFGSIILLVSLFKANLKSLSILINKAVAVAPLGLATAALCGRVADDLRRNRYCFAPAAGGLLTKKNV